MISIMLLSENKREGQILTMAFEQLQIKVIQSSPSYANYVKTLQYIPDIVVMEIPRLNSNQLHFSSLLRKNKKTKKIPIIGFGNIVEKNTSTNILKNGINSYLTRPLKFSNMIKIIQNYIKLMNKTIKTDKTSTDSEKKEDIKKILSPQTLPVDKIELMIKHIGNLMAFPFTVTKVLQLAESNRSGANDLAKVIEADPIISTSLLKVSNTVFFASRDRRISTIKEAIIRIGFTETKRIVITMAVMDSFSKDNNNLGFDRMQFWTHAIATAIIAGNLAKQINGITQDDVFLPGLLHDFGIILLDEFYPSIFEQILLKTTNDLSRFIDAEQNILTITHNDIAAKLFVKWKLPDSVTSTVTLYTDILQKDIDISTKENKIAFVISIANQLAKVYCFGASCDQYIKSFGNSFFPTLGIAAGLKKDFRENIQRELKIYQAFLNIEDDNTYVADNKLSIGIFNVANLLHIPIEVFFASQKHEIIHIPIMEDYSEFNQKLDIICAWLPNDTNGDILQQLSNIVKKSNDQLDVTLQTSKVPILTIMSPKSPMLQAVSKYSSCIYDELDLRQLDEYIYKIMANEKVTPT